MGSMPWCRFLQAVLSIEHRLRPAGRVPFRLPCVGRSQQNDIGMEDFVPHY